MNRRTPFTLCAAALSLATIAPAQAKWTKPNPATSPSRRAALTAAVSPTAMYVFGGGRAVGGLSDELWSFNGTTWTNLTPASGNPPPRTNAGLAYDQIRNRVVLFGGQGVGGVVLGDLWEFDGTNWSRRTPATMPPKRRACAMAYDSIRNVTVVHGGEDGGTFMDDTWEWNGMTWKLVATPTKTSRRARHQMVFDTKRRHMVTFGGSGPSWLVPVTDKDTWTYNGTDWSKITTTVVPKAKNVTATGLLVYGMAYDRLRDRVILTAGYGNQTYQSDTWEFDGTDWKNRGTPAGFAIRGGAAMGFVLGTTKTYLFGGFNGTSRQLGDTWEYQTDAFPTFNLSGTACNTSAGAPTLSATTQPWLDSTFEVAVTPVPTSAPVLVIIGGASTNLPLTALGAPGCTAYASFDLTLPAMTSGTSASLGLALPDMPFLAGQSIYVQGAVRDASTNTLGFGFTARGTAKLGAY